MKKLLFLCVTICALMVAAFSTVMAADDINTDRETKISVDIITDNTEYQKGDKADLEVLITNNSTYTYKNLYYKITMPENISLAESVPDCGNFTLNANSAHKIGLISENPDVPKDNTNNDSDDTDDTNNITLLIIAIVIVLICASVLSFLLIRKRRKNTTAVILIIVLNTSCLCTIDADASVPALDDFSMTATKTISIDNEDAEILVEITSNSDTAENPSSVLTSDISIHDPSVFYDPVSGNYYSYGSHIISGKSSDLVSWVYTSNSSVGYATSNQLFSKHYLEEFADIYDWLGSDVREGIWALDVTYSEAAAKAGNDPYFMYVTVTNAVRDALCLATAPSPEGPFSFKDVLVYSDFRESEVKSGQVNLLEVLGVESFDELTAEQKNYYITKNTDEYRGKFPQCIDAAPYYDADGNMYLAYGSFSSVGAIHVLKLNPLTGLRAEDNYTYNPSELQDPYYGRQIATKRGEGPYVLRVSSELSSTGSYYFLFWSQGTLAAQGGYNMRVLRSEYPDRGFKDYSGKSAMDSSVVGLRLMDNFWFTTMKYSSTANGGNSAIVTKDGKIFLHYHSKSAHSAAYGGTGEGFIIKSNQMFLNEDGWLTVTPFKYYGETMEPVSEDDVVGDYEFIYHTLDARRRPANFNDNFALSETVTLNADGTVTGDYNGIWEMDGNYFNITVGDKTYKGVVLKQFDESEDRVNTIVFTATGTDNRAVWGSKIYYTSDERIATDSKYISVPATAEDDFTLTSLGRLHSKITWTSDSDAIRIEGNTAKLIRQDEDCKVTLTATVTHDEKSVTKQFEVTIPAEEIFVPSTVSTSSISLPVKTAAGKKITWTSSNPSVINTETGVVKISDNSSEKVTLTGTIEGSTKTIIKEVTVTPLPTTIKYEENYNAVTSIDASLTTSIWYSTNASSSVSLKPDNEGGKYVEFAPGTANSRGAVSSFPAVAQSGGIYILDFDVALTAGDDQTTEFAVTTQNMAYHNNVINDGIAAGYLFKLSSTNSTTWAINDGDTFTLPKGDWVHISVLADTESGTATVTITDDGNTIYTGTVEMNGAEALKGFYVRGGRRNSVTCVDNITLKAN